MSFENNNYQNQPGTTPENPSPSFPQNRNFYGQLSSENGLQNGSYNSAPQVYGNIPNYANTPPQPTIEPPRPPQIDKKSNSNIAKIIAAMLAVAVISGASGGGVSYLILKGNALITQSQSDTSPPQEIPERSESSAPQESSAAASVPAGNASDISGVVEKASESVVEIQVEATMSNPFFGRYSAGGSGSGVILTQDGYIATNDHVVEGAEKITVRTKDGNEYEAKLIGTDSQSDLAVIKVEAEGLTPAEFADSDQIKVGEVAIAIGNPLGTLGGTVTQGIISAKDREIDFETDNGTIETMTLIQTSAAVNPGNSGGGLFNARGELVGIVNAKTSGNSIEGLGFAIPSNTVLKVTEDLKTSGYVMGRPQLGISVVEVFDAQTAFYYRVSEPGVYVLASTEENGLNIGDLFVSIDGTEIKSSSDVKNSISGKNVGDTCDIVVKREGQNVTVTVTLSEKIPESVKQAVRNSEV